jgi:hypothetical protein
MYNLTFIISLVLVRAMASSSDMVEIIPMATETVSSTQTPIHGYTFETEEGTPVNMADLKPIIMMANMATVSEEVQVYNS